MYSMPSFSSADHAAIGDNAGARDAEARSQPINHRRQDGHVSGVVGHHLGADRPALGINNQRQDHLRQIGAEVLGMLALAQRLAARAMEGQRVVSMNTRLRSVNRSCRRAKSFSSITSFTQRATRAPCPPSAAVRHSSIAVMTRRWATDSDASCCPR